MSLPSLQTRRLSLKPLSSEHKSKLHDLDTNPEVMRYIFTGNALTDDESNMVFDHLIQTKDPEHGLGCWVGYDGDDFVGWWVVAPSETPTEDQKNKEENTSHSNTDRVEIGMRVDPKHWGKGYAKEGLQALLKHCLDDMGVNEVYGETMAVNTGSRATMEKCGLKHVRTWHNTYEDFTPAPGIEEGEVEYRVTREEWVRRNS